LTKAHSHKKLALIELLLVTFTSINRLIHYDSFGGLFMRLIISVVAFAVLVGGVLTACNSAEWKAKTSPPATRAQTAAPAPSDGARRVTVAELKDMLARNEAVVIDVRNQASYDIGHIKGARLIPEAEVANHVDELPKNKLIVTYCS
jgi:3-mercaptopyruvate sulfurtransferase SseA